MLYGALFCILGHVADVGSTKLNDKYSHWAGIHETNDLAATPDGRASTKYMVELKSAWLLTFVFPFGLFLLLATKSPLVASLPFWFDGYELWYTAAGNFLLLARYHHFLHP